jgi:integrase
VVLGAAPPELRLAIALGVCTGMRESDVLAFPWSGYKDGLIEGRAAKTGTPIWMPAHPMLMELLDAAPRKSPVVVIGARGRPYTQNGFQSRFFKLIRALKSAGRVAPGLTFHGLRTTTVTLLAEAGCDTQTIMAISGHATEAMVAHYRRDADQKDRAESAIARLNLRGERKANKSV